MFQYQTRPYYDVPRPSELDPMNQHKAEYDRAFRLFRRQRTRGLINRIWSKITSKCCCLMHLSKVADSFSHSGGSYKGIKPVQIDRIQGSENRTTDLDNQFHPLREGARDRWMRISVLMMVGEPLPAVELIQVGDDYFVRDGHHRISAARALGLKHIDAEVTAWQPQNHELSLAG